MNRELQDELIRKGAAAEMVELEARMGTLRELLAKGPRPGRPPAAPTNVHVNAKRKRSKMSPAARKAVSQRMRAFWAARRKEK